ncbi:ABC transporter permease [Dehalococcoidia bacterium]|nr:ABC transporter permease [Dehalococcoidia bacterium]
MRAYIIRRLLLIIPTLLILSMLVFLSVRFIPGDTIDLIATKMEAFVGPGAQVDRELIERKLGLDVSVGVQYGRWLGVLPTPDWATGETQFRGILQGNLGNSLIRDSPITELISARLPVTIELGVLALVLGFLIAMPVGIYSAMRQDTAADYVGRTGAIIGMATPNFWLALMIMIFPAIWWGWSPPMKWVPLTEDPLGNLGILIIPSLILGTAGSAGIMRLTRTMMLEVLRQDYIRTAWSKGLRERSVITRHAIKNASIPVVTVVGMELGTLVGGSVIMENIFNLPGMGRLLLTALAERDYPVVSGINIVYAVLLIGTTLIIDLIYPYLDPRIRYR